MNQEFPSLYEGSLEITFTVPLGKFIYNFAITKIAKKREEKSQRKVLQSMCRNTKVFYFQFHGYCLKNDIYLWLKFREDVFCTLDRISAT